MELILKKNLKLLALTPIKQTFGIKEKIFFLGYWCNAFSKQKFFKNRNHQFFKHPYNVDGKKFSSDHKYLLNLRSRLLKQLTLTLNHIHKLNYSEKEWNLIIGRWLHVYTSVLFDRWEILRSFFVKNSNKKYLVYLINSKDKKVIKTLDFVENCLYSDLWNHQLFKKIILFKYKKKLQIKNIKKINDDSFCITSSKIDKNLYYYMSLILNKISFFLARFFLNFNRVIFDGYISKNAYLKFCFKFKILPFNVNSFFDVDNFNYSTKFKKNFFNNLKFPAKNQFETFLVSNIDIYFPEIFTRRFESLRYSIMKFISEKKIIISQIAFLFNDIYNIWLVEMLRKKSFFIPSHHGGSLVSKNAINYSRKDLSKHYIVWHKPLDKTDVQLSPLKLLERNIILKKIRKNCLIITAELPRYYYVTPDAPIVENNIYDFLKIIKMINNLKSEVTNSIILRNSQNSDWGYESIAKQKLNNKIKFSTNNNIYKDFIDAKLAICAYPSTPFSESINLNIPSIFFFNKKTWNIHDKFKGLLNDMENENLFFYDADRASKHINNIWDNVDGWWNKNSVQKVIKRCKEDFYRINKAWLNEYNNFFNKFA